MKAKEYLLRIKEIDTAVRIKNDELLRLRERASGIGGYPDGEKVQSSKATDKMADAVVKYVDIKDELIRETLELAKERQAIIDTISRLESTQYDVLYRKYVKGENYYDIADAYQKSYRWAVAKRKQGLNNLQKILDKEELDGRKENQ